MEDKSEEVMNKEAGTLEELMKKERKNESIDKMESLKKEFESIANVIANKDNYTFESTNTAMETLCSLMKLNLEVKSQSDEATSSSSKPRFPKVFYCPLSGHLMNDPVLMTPTGQTYDRKFIESWLINENPTCPQTERVLSANIVLTPNKIVQDIITKWHKDHELPNYPSLDYNFETIKTSDREHLKELLHKIDSTDGSDQVQAGKELLNLTWERPYSRVLFWEIEKSMDLLLKLHYNTALLQILITIIHNLSIHESNKKLIAENTRVRSVIIDALESGNIHAKRYAAACIFRLSSVEENKHTFLGNGTLRHLFNLLREGDPLVMKNTVSSIRNLCRVIGTQDTETAVKEGAVKIIMTKLTHRHSKYLVDDLLGILERLSCADEANEEMEKLEGVNIILDILRANASNSIQDNCLAILFRMCLNENMLSEIKKEEDRCKIFSIITKNGTQETKRKAKRLITLFGEHDKGGRCIEPA